MKCLQTVVVACLTYWCVGLGLSKTSLADQYATELPALFQQLEQAAEPSEAARLEAMIWQHWVEAPDAESEELMSRISQAMAGADLAVALQICNQLVESYPDYAEAWNRRATLHYMLGNNEQSVSDIRETVAREPRHFGAISGLGLIFLRDQNFDAALAAFEQVLAISPASESASQSVARLRQELEREI